MVAEPSELGGRYFKSKKERNECIRSILKDGIRVLTGKELAVVHDLLLLHPDADRKIGVGVKHIKVDWRDKTKQYYCFWIVRVDGSVDHFSYLKCTYSRDRLIKIRRQSAYREAINEQTGYYRFIERKSSQICDFCGSSQNIHVDHHKPLFDSLVSDFEKERSDILIEFEESGEGEYYSKRFRDCDSAYRKAWQDYHQKHATLRLLCKEHSLSIKRKESRLGD